MPVSFIILMGFVMAFFGALLFLTKHKRLALALLLVGLLIAGGTSTLLAFAWAQGM